MAEHGYIPQPPHINRRHIDGPLLTFSDGQMHWLTWRERFQVWWGSTDAWLLQLKHRPDLRKLTYALRWAEENL